MYLLRLDDASEYMDTAKWKKIERILDQYKIKPMVGVIPNNEDTSLITRYKQDPLFWNKVYRWIDKGWRSQCMDTIMFIVQMMAELIL